MIHERPPTSLRRLVQTGAFGAVRARDGAPGASREGFTASPKAPVCTSLRKPQTPIPFMNHAVTHTHD